VGGTTQRDAYGEKRKEDVQREKRDEKKRIMPNPGWDFFEKTRE